MCEVMDNPGSVLKRLRGTTKQKALCVSLGISKDTIWRIESGLVTTWPTYCKIVRALGYSFFIDGFRGDVSHRLGEVFESKRFALGLNQKDAGALAGISGPYLSTIESGLVPSWRVLRSLMLVYRISLKIVYVDAMYDYCI